MNAIAIVPDEKRDQRMDLTTVRFTTSELALIRRKKPTGETDANFARRSMIAMCLIPDTIYGIHVELHQSLDSLAPIPGHLTGADLTLTEPTDLPVKRQPMEKAPSNGRDTAVQMRLGTAMVAVGPKGRR